MEKLFEAHAHSTLAVSVEEQAFLFRREMAAAGIEKICFLSIPNEVNEKVYILDRMQNVKNLFLKCVFGENGYAYAGLEHSIDESDKSGLSKSFLSQAIQYHKNGYDGIKMLEGYPAVRKHSGYPLCDEVYDEFYSYLEENGIPVTMHVANPASYWDADKIGEDAKKAGRLCDDTFPTKSELLSEVFEILKKHPKLKLYLAHFGFMIDNIEMAERFLSDYEFTGLDTTPGETIALSKNWDAWKPFFDKYQDRIIYGSDFYAWPRAAEEPVPEETYKRSTVVRQLFETNEENIYFGKQFKGVNLDKGIRQKVYFDNAMKLLGASKTVNLEYLRNKVEELLREDYYFNGYTKMDLEYIKRYLEENK